MSEARDLAVRTLLGHAQVPIALRCLASLQQCSAESVTLRIHDDGTLAAADIDALRSALPGCDLVARRDADDAVLPHLTRHPHCRAFRQTSPLALKLFDVALLETGDLAYCDSDVLFLRRVRGLYEWSGAHESCAFMADVLDAYALRPWHVSPLTSLRVLAKANSGLIHFRDAAGIDLDVLEHVLGRPPLQAMARRRPYWVEQTCWAALGARGKATLFDPAQVRIVTPEVDLREPTLLAAHFVSTYRSRIHEIVPQSGEGSAPTAPSVVRRVAAPTTDPVRLLWSDITRRRGAGRPS